jgi:hypothetical protein
MSLLKDRRCVSGSEQLESEFVFKDRPARDRERNRRRGREKTEIWFSGS